MNLLEAIVLGIVQGATEFIPVSSSGHLIIARDILGISGSVDLAFDAVLQLATAMAVLVFFRREIGTLFVTGFNILRRKVTEASEKTFLYAVLLGTIPAVIFGLLLESYMETTFRSSLVVAIMLILGALLMFFAEKRLTGEAKVSGKKGFAIGLFQALALVPGISRSGATISGGMILGLSREKAAKFSFILSFPILFGSGLKKLLDLTQSGELVSIGTPLLVGSIVAFVVGLMAIRFLIGFLKTKTLQPFIIYRLFLAALIFIFL